jgi:hypothetical protein
MTSNRGSGLRLRLVACVLLIGAAIVAGGCGPVTQAVKAIDDAIANINANSDAWRSQLDSLAEQLKGTEKQAAFDVQRIALNATNNVGDQAKCTVAFTGTYVVEQLKRLKAKLLKQPFPPVNPAVCTTNPRDAVSLDQVKDGMLTTVEFDGYNMDTGGFGLAVHDDATGRITPVPAQDVQYNSPYVAVLDLTKFSIPDAKGEFLYFGHGASYTNQSLSIQPTTTPPPPPPPVTLAPLQIHLETTDENKDDDSVLTVQLIAYSGLILAQWHQVGNLEFKENTAYDLTLVPLNPPVTVGQATDSTISICIAPNGNDVWNFNWRLNSVYHGGVSDGQPLAVGQDGVSASDERHCYSDLILRPPTANLVSPPPASVTTPGH